MDIYDIARECSEKAAAIPYGEMPKEPKYDDFDSPTKYGRAMAQYKRERDTAKAQREAWHGEQDKVNQEFKQRIAKALGLENHPKFDTLYRITWDEGHSSGFNEVAMHCDTLSELLKP